MSRGQRANATRRNSVRDPGVLAEWLKRNRTTLYGVWPKGRNTPIVVDATSAREARRAARKKRAAGAQGPIVAIRRLRGRDLRDARAGRWVRTRADGSRTSATGPYTYRPQLRARAKGRRF